VHLILAASSDPFAVENNPVVRWFMAFASVGGVIIAIRGLRRLRSWMLFVSGTKAVATVATIEYSGSNGERRPLRRPLVSFTTEAGQQVTAAPELYRPRWGKAKGEAVEIRYDVRNPERVAVSGFDFRAADLVPVVAGLLVTVVTVSWSLGH
jgi:hypothetical protein